MRFNSTPARCSSLVPLAAAFALFLCGCSASDDGPQRFHADIQLPLDPTTQAQLKPGQTHRQGVALADGLQAQITFEGARGPEGALYVRSAAIDVEETQGWTLSVAPASPPLNIADGRGQDAVMQTTVLVTQQQSALAKTRLRTTRIEIRADGTVNAQ